MNDQPETDETPGGDDAARRAALARLAARSTEPNDPFDRDVLARVDADGWGYQPETVDDQPGIETTPAVAEDERSQRLRREAEELAADAVDRAEIAELRGDLGGWSADPPT